VKKLKWLNASFGMSLSTLSDRLKKVRFDAAEDDTYGFRIDERKLDRISGVFVERETSYETISLPSGEQYEEKHSRVLVTQFVFSSASSLNLLLLDGPRRTIPFFNALGAATEYKISLDSVDANILEWVVALEKRVGSVRVLFLDCNGIQLSPTITGRFAFRGSEDVRAEMRRAVKGGKPSIESARCEILIDGAPHTIELFRSGTVKLNDRVLSTLAETVRASLSDALGEAL